MRTPGKWKQNRYKILDESGKIIAKTIPLYREVSECVDNAEFIIEAVNEYEDLKAENQKLRKALSIYADPNSWLLNQHTGCKDVFHIGENGFSLAEVALKGG